MFGEKIIRTNAIILVFAFFLVSINIAIFIDATTKFMPDNTAIATDHQHNEVEVIVDNNQEILVANKVEAENQDDLAGTKSDKASREDKKETEELRFGTYRVARGDSLYWIAERYDTTVAELKQLNQLTSDSIQSSQVLVVPIDTLKEYPVGVSLTDQEVQWIAQMVHAEARGEPYSGQVAVGAVIINRLKSRQFPNTVYEVLFQNNAFQPIRNGQFFVPANESAYRATLEALNGKDPTDGALFFFNPAISNDRFMHARPAVVTIGQHRFMY